MQSESHQVQVTQTETRQSDWNRLFQQRPWGKYPADELIRFVARNYYAAQNRAAVRLLDLGCGIGANTWYMAKEGFLVDAVDGSQAALDLAQQRLSAEGLSAHFQQSFLSTLPFEDDTFDAVLDQACITCNPWTEAESIVREVKRVLKPGGKFHSALLGQETTIQGRMIEPHYYEEITVGALHGVPSSRLYSEAEVSQLFQSFEDVSIEYQLRTVDRQQIRVQQWIVEARCPG